MSYIKQCQPVSEVIKHLQKIKDQNALLIFDYYNQEDIENALCYANDEAPTTEEAREVMLKLDKMYIFDIANQKNNEDALDFMVQELGRKERDLSQKVSV